jgi:hypothetical protein
VHWKTFWWGKVGLLVHAVVELLMGRGEVGCNDGTAMAFYFVAVTVPIKNIKNKSW